MPPENEQQQDNANAPSVEPTTPGHATREDLIAAVRAAGGVASAAESEPAKPEPTTPVETPAPAEEDRLTRLLREREKGFAEREAARQSAQAILEEANREKQRIIDEAKAEARRAIEQEQQQRRERIRQSPIEGVRELYDDPQKLVDEVLQHTTPEARARRELEQKLQSLEAEAKDGKDAKAELAKFRQELAAEKQAEIVAQYRTEFMTTEASADKAPYLHAIAKANGQPAETVFDRCNALCQQWQRSGLVLNGSGENGFAPSDLVAYLEKQARGALSGLSPAQQAAQQVSAAAPTTGPGNAPKVSANGPRTLSAAPGSERRSSPTPFNQLNAAQKRQALIEEVAAARRRNPDALD